MLERTRHLAQAVNCLRAGLGGLAAGHLAAARANDPLPGLIGAAVEAARRGRHEEAARMCERAEALLAEEAGGVSRRDAFLMAVATGLLAAEGDKCPDVGLLIVELADDVMAAADDVRYTLTMERPDDDGPRLHVPPPSDN
jgi:hypothetical protein